MPVETAMTMAGRALALVTALALAMVILALPAVADEAPCRYDNRMVPHGTQIGVLRCENGRWVRAGG